MATRARAYSKQPGESGMRVFLAENLMENFLETLRSWLRLFPSTMSDRKC